VTRRSIGIGLFFWRYFLTFSHKETLPTGLVPQGWFMPFVFATIAALLVLGLIELGTWAWVVSLATVAVGFVAPLLLSQTWRMACTLIVPAVLAGVIWTFKVGAGTRIAPTLVVAFICIVITSFGLLRQNVDWRRLPLLIPFSMYWIAVALSYFPAVSKMHWARGLLETSLGYGFFLLGYGYLQNRAQLRSLLKLVVVVVVVTVLFGLVQLWLLDYLHGLIPLLYDEMDTYWVYHWAEPGRMVANWAHPSYLGAIINLAAPIALCYYLESERLQLKYLFAYCLLGFGVVMTSTRTPIVAFVISSAFLVVLLRKNMSRLVLPLFGFLLLGGFAAPFVISSIQRFDLSDPDNQATVVGRAEGRYAAYLLFLEHPLRGVGSRNYQDVVFIADPNAQGETHNVFIEEAAETGLMGVVPFIALLYLAFRGDFRRLRECPRDLRAISYALFAACIAIVIECFAENSLLVWQISSLFWLFRGISVAIRTRQGSLCAPALADQPLAH